MARIQHNSEMRNSVQIRQFQSTDQAALLAFLADAYRDEPRKIDIAFWKWHYLENPLTDPDNIPLWIVESGGKIVGQLATIPVELKVGNKF